MIPRWYDLAVGDTRTPMTGEELTVTDFVRYQGASGDMNPVHHDAEFARRAGYPKPFAVGMLQASILGNFATDWLGLDNVRRFKVQFREQAWPGDVITYAGVVAAKYVRSGTRLVDVDLTATREGGGIHILGWATFALSA